MPRETSLLCRWRIWRGRESSAIRFARRMSSSKGGQALTREPNSLLSSVLQSFINSDVPRERIVPQHCFAMCGMSRSHASQTLSFLPYYNLLLISMCPGRESSAIRFARRMSRSHASQTLSFLPYYNFLLIPMCSILKIVRTFFAACGGEEKPS